MSSFPNALLHVINCELYANAIGWGPDGCVWINPVAFQKHALKVHFQGVKKFASFTRKLNRYGFRKIIEKESGSDDIVFYRHDTFRQGISHAVASTIRIQKKGAAIAQASKPIPSQAFPQVSEKTPKTIVDTFGYNPSLPLNATMVQDLLRRQSRDRVLGSSLFRPLAEPRLPASVISTLLKNQIAIKTATACVGDCGILSLNRFAPTTIPCLPSVTPVSFGRLPLTAVPSQRHRDIAFLRAGNIRPYPGNPVCDRKYSFLGMK